MGAEHETRGLLLLWFIQNAAIHREHATAVCALFQNAHNISQGRQIKHKENVKHKIKVGRR